MSWVLSGVYLRRLSLRYYPCAQNFGEKFETATIKKFPTGHIELINLFILQQVMPNLIFKDPKTLTQYSRNARLHSNAQLDEIEASMLAFTWTRPILIDENDMILAGHGRYMVAIRRGMKLVPCIVKAGLTQEEKIAYIIADNALAELAHWDEEALAIELSELKDSIDLTITGFDFEFDLEAIERDERITSGDGVKEFIVNDVVVPAKYKCPNCEFEF